MPRPGGRHPVGYQLHAVAAEVDPDGSVVGSSFGAAVAVYTGGVDDRVAAVISSGGWGNGERKFRGQHPGEERKNSPTCSREGKSIGRKPASRFSSIATKLSPSRTSPGQHAVGVGTAVHRRYSAGDDGITAEDVIAHIAAPRSAAAQFCGLVLRLNNRSKCSSGPDSQPTHLTADTDHFMMAESNTRVINIISDWLAGISRPTRHGCLRRRQTSPTRRRSKPNCCKGAEPGARSCRQGFTATCYLVTAALIRSFRSRRRS